MIAVSRLALRGALAARSAEEELQRRWGVASVRRAVLPYAEPILVTLEAEQRKPVSRFAHSVRLGGQTFEFVLADEQAKANVNAMLGEAAPPQVESRLRQALSGFGLSNRLKLRPTVGPAVMRLPDPNATTATTQPLFTDQWPHVGALGQVFDAVPPGQLLRPAAGSRSAAVDLLTCWGGGQVNVRRASDAALTLAAGKSLTRVEVNRLIDARNKLFERRPSITADEESPAEKLKALMLEAASQSVKNRGNLALVDGSTCHSLWVVSRNNGRDGYDLFVVDRADERRPVVWSYQW